MKKILTALLAMALLLSLGGCGESDGMTGFRRLAVIGTRQYSIIYRKDDKIAPLVDAALASLAGSGELTSISVRWLGRDAIVLSGMEETPEPEETEPPDETEETPAPEESDAPVRTLIVGVEQDFDPMAFVENGILRGMSVDIASALAGELGWRVSYQPISPAEVGTQLSSGNIDCALGFDSGAVDEGGYTVGLTYMESDIVLASRQGSDIRSVRDVRGQRIGTVDDPVVKAAVKADEDISRYASGATVYLSPRRCLNALDNGWCAAIAMDVIMLERAV